MTMFGEKDRGAPLRRCAGSCAALPPSRFTRTGIAWSATRVAPKDASEKTAGTAVLVGYRAAL